MVRFKSRYILLEIINNECYSLTPGKILSIIKDNIERLGGVVGFCKLGHYLSIKYFNLHTGLTIIRAPRSFIQEMLSVLNSLDSKNQSLIHESFYFKIIHVSGTIKSAQKHALKYLSKILKGYELERCKTDIRSIQA